MFYIAVGILVLIVVAVLVEVVLFWAAAGLGDAPDLTWGKTFVVSLLASVLAGTAGAIAISLRSISLFAPENRLLLAMLGVLALLVSWVIPGVLYAPLVSVSIPRGMFISVVQVLLRIFLYVLIAAVVLVVMAILQIVRS